jgi:hypothetical protein
MDFQTFVFKMNVHICYYSKNSIEISWKTKSYVKNPMTYSTGPKNVFPPFLGISVTLSFLSEIMKNQVLNKAVCYVV